MNFDMFGNANIENIRKTIFKIPFGGYAGNKRKIITAIWKILSNEGIVFDSVFDAFSGSAVFSLFMKLAGKKVIANDFLTSSYLNALSLVENPSFFLSYDEIMFVINNVPEYDKTRGFVYTNYKNARFTEQECFELDRLRINLNLLGNSYKSGIGFLSTKNIIAKTPFGMIDRGVDLYKHRKKQIEQYGKGSKNHDRRIGLYFDKDLNLDFKTWFPKYNKRFEDLIFRNNDLLMHIENNFLLRNINSNVLRNCFLDKKYDCGHCISDSVHKKNHEKRQSIANIDFFKELIKDFFSNDKHDELFEGFRKPCLALNVDIIELLENSDFVTDLIYLDPPYGGDSSDYAYLYQFLEEYVYGCSIQELEHIQKYGKRFVNKKTYEENFVKMLSLSDRFPIWLLSYNNSSWQNKDYILKLLKNFKKNVKVFEINNYIYNYRINKKQKSGVEYIFIAR